MTPGAMMSQPRLLEGVTMQRATLTSVSSQEWRWVILLGGLLVALTLLPYAWAFTSAAPASGHEFMGILYNPLDGATYLSKIGQGARGEWLFTLGHTPERHEGAFIQAFYLLLGHLARLVGFTPLVMFHIARLATGFMMYIAIYHLGSTIWQRTRPRRLFFGMLAVGAGLGWLALALSPNSLDLPTDLKIPESIPLYATFVNPHFPLTIALIALLASIFVTVFRPGFDKIPTLTNGGGAVVVVAVAMAFVQPQGFVPIGLSIVAYVVILAIRSRRWPMLEIRWVALVILPALPVLLYYLVVTNTNDALRIWNEQNQTPSPTVDRYLLGFGLLLILAIPGVWRAVRRFERDGDRFMLLWLVVNALLLYAPFNLQRRFAIGLIIPIVYFGVRALEDYWFHVISFKWRAPALIALIVFLLPSNIISFGLPLVGVIDPESGVKGRLLSPSGYAEAMRWLNVNGRVDDVVLAPPDPSLWIPAYTPLRVVYGHPFETVDAEQKLREVEAFYGDTLADNACLDLMARYNVRFILAKATPSSRRAPDEWPMRCLAALGLQTPLRSFGDVSLFEVVPTAP
jgi:hypothetical protein